MDLDLVPRLQGSRVILRPHRNEDIAQRASLGRRRDIVRAMGGNISSDRSMTQAAARKQINRRFGPGPHWTVADPLAGRCVEFVPRKVDDVPQSD